jgi:transcriptional regulator with XRE-family HTH domain
MEIKNILKQRRLELGLTLLDVAKKVGVSEATVSRWESGEIENMRRDKIALLAKALDLNPSVIMGWEKSPSPEEENPDIRMIARAGKKMTPEQAENLRKYAEFMYPEAFVSDDK